MSKHDKRALIAWIGGLYGGISTLFLLTQYILVLVRRPMQLEPEAANPLLAMSFVVFELLFFALALSNLPRHFIPIGPPDWTFLVVMRAFVLLAFVSFLLSPLAFVHSNGTNPRDLILVSFFLWLSVYVLAHFSAGYVALGSPSEEKRIGIVLEGIRNHDVRGTCAKYGLPESIYYRWKQELLTGPTKAAIASLEKQK